MDVISNFRIRCTAANAPFFGSAIDTLLILFARATDRATARSK
jgi:hypothetical protein